MIAFFALLQWPKKDWSVKTYFYLFFNSAQAKTGFKKQKTDLEYFSKQEWKDYRAVKVYFYN